MKTSMSRAVRWVASGAVLLGVSVGSFYLGASLPPSPDVEAEAVLRRALSLVAFERTDPQVSVLSEPALPDSLAELLRGFCELRFVDTFPFDLRSASKFFLRPATVWDVRCGVSGRLEAEVRPADAGWVVMLRPLRPRT